MDALLTLEFQQPRERLALQRVLTSLVESFDLGNVSFQIFRDAVLSRFSHGKYKVLAGTKHGFGVKTLIFSKDVLERGS